MLNISTEDFISLLDGVFARVKADNEPTPECFDLAQLWARVIGSQPFTGATADLIYNQPGDLYTQIPNTPNDFPQKGDLVIWNWPHVGLATGNNTDANTLEVFEQNDPDGSEIHIKQYANYDGVIGWLRPKVTPTGQGSLPINYSQIVHGSTQWDQACQNLELGDPTTTQYDTLGRVIAGYKSRETDWSNKLIIEQQATVKAQADSAGKDTIISNLEQEVSDTQTNDKAEIDKLNKNVKDEQKLVDQLQGSIKDLQGNLRASTQKVADLTKQIAILQAGKKSWFQKIVDIVSKIFTHS
jgi:hypothetical protein